MSADHFAPIPYHSPRTTAVLNAPLAQLDRAIGKVANVMEFGAVADGVTDDSGAFAAAWDAGYTTVDVPEVTVGIGTRLAPPAGCSIRGRGRGSVMKRLPGLPDWQEMVLLWQDDSWIDGIRFDGNAGVVGTLTGAEVGLAAARNKLVRCTFTNWDHIGVDMHGAYGAIRGCVFEGSFPADDGTWEQPSWVGIYMPPTQAEPDCIGNEISGCVGYGTYLGTIGVGGYMTRCIGNHVWGSHQKYRNVDDLDQFFGGGSIVASGSGPYTGGHVIADNVIDGTLAGPAATGFEIDGVGIILQGNQVINAPGFGIILQSGSDLTVMGNRIVNSGWGRFSDLGALTGQIPVPGIRVENIDGIRIVGNRVTQSATYGIELASGAEAFVIGFNDLFGNDSGPVNDASGASSKRYVGNLPGSVTDV